MNNLRSKICGCYGCVVVCGCDAFQMDSFYVYGCPCRKCVVKMVCGDNCDDYDKFNRRIYKDKHFISNMKKTKRPMYVSEKHNLLRQTK